jgi:uncharacterized membrane protein
VIASIAQDLSKAIAAEVDESEQRTSTATPEVGLSPTELFIRMEQSGTEVAATQTGYLQFVGYDELVAIALQTDSVIRLLYRPGHFVVEGLPLATVWPAGTADAVAKELERNHVTGPQRTLTQDLSFAIDQLVEIAIRALSPAVNDTFSALTCIDWLTDALCRISARWRPSEVHRDGVGAVRVIAAELHYERLVGRAFDKIRQAGRGMPAVLIRQLDALAKVMVYTTNEEQRVVLFEQADMILRSSVDSVPEASDQLDVLRRYEAVAAARALAVSGVTTGSTATYSETSKT